MLVVEVEENIVGGVVGEFTEALETLKGFRQDALVIDLNGAEMICASGLSPIIRLFKRSRAAGKVVSVVTRSLRVRELFEVTHLSRWIGVYGSVSEWLFSSTGKELLFEPAT